MRETCEIIEAYQSLCAEGKPSALATVTRVVGSSYRRPGAKMLIAEDGRTWGGVSGGCLERDVSRQGRIVIATGQPLICKYDSDDEDFDSPGTLATGCGGVVHLFIQPLSPQFPGPLQRLQQAILLRRAAWVATVVGTSIGCKNLIGITVAPDELKTIDARRQSIRRFLQTRIEHHQSLRQDHYELARHSIGSESVLVAIEFIAPPLPLVIFGDGPDVRPLVEIASTVGWHTTVVGMQSHTGLRNRFPQADILCSTSRDNPTNAVEITEDSAVVIMTHNVHRDRLILQSIPKRLRYLGILGPRHRTRRLLEMAQIEPTDREHLFTPVGLDLGSQMPAEIALSIAAEIQAVIRNAPAGFLKNKPGRINNRKKLRFDLPKRSVADLDERIACPIQA